MLLSELSPLCLWLFNTRNLSTITTARFITLMLNVGPDRLGLGCPLALGFG